MFKSKNVVTSLVAVCVLGGFSPTLAQATEASSKSDATLNVTKAKESGSLRFDTPEKLNITFADMEISEKTLKEIETKGIGEKDGTKAQLKVVDERMDIKGDPTFYVTAKMTEGNYGDKNFLQNGMYVSLGTDTSEGAYPFDLNGAQDTIIATGDKKTPIEKDLNARLHVSGNALDLKAGNYGTSITWTAVPTVVQ
ncbi:hypothetical protein [Enterococcus sp. AZ126]|uniref:hypothetical protein n=1 Tax=Enterococcus sp. AZ126 TaxID=2774635 RepID=UPI003F28B94A